MIRGRIDEDGHEYRICLVGTSLQDVKRLIVLGALLGEKLVDVAIARLGDATSREVLTSPTALDVLARMMQRTEESALDLVFTLKAKAQRQALTSGSPELEAGLTRALVSTLKRGGRP